MKMRSVRRTNPARKPRKNRLIAAVFSLAAVLFLPACYPVTGGGAYCDLSRSDPALPDESSKVVPMMRIGSLPHPFGPIPVRYGDHDDLGTHSIRHSAFRSIRLGEASGGIIYTQRIGFIDLAHTRNTADLTWTCYQRILPALVESRPRVLLAGAEPSLFLLHLDYPPGWAGLSPDARKRLAEHIAVPLAVRMGYVISTWHEVLTSFGFKGVTGIPEEQSAFAYDDQPSHLLGAVAAGRAIQRVQAALDIEDPEDAWNPAMTGALAEVLAEYGALDTRGTRRAVAAAEGVWWGIDGPSVRQIHLGMQNEPFTPLLIHPDHPDVLGPQAEGASALVSYESPTPFPIPFTWQAPAPTLGPRWFPTHDLLPAVRVTIDPRTRYAEELLQHAATPGPWLDLDTHGPALKQHLQQRFAPEP